MSASLNLFLRSTPASLVTNSTSLSSRVMASVLGNRNTTLIDWSMLSWNSRTCSGEIERRASGRAEAPDITRDATAFTAEIRTRLFAFLRAWSIGNDEAALGAIDSAVDGAGQPWTSERLGHARDAFRDEHHDLRFDPEARNLRHTHAHPSDDGTTWRVEQMLVDREGFNDWVAELEVDLDASRRAAEPVLKLLRLESLVPSSRW